MCWDVVGKGCGQTIGEESLWGDWVEIPGMCVLIIDCEEGMS